MSGQLALCLTVAFFLFLLTFGLRGFATCIVCLLCLVLGILASVLRRGWRRADELAREFATLDVCLKASPLDLPEIRFAKAETRLTGSQIIDPHLTEIIDYLLRDFVESWYQTITDDQQFPIRLKSTAFKATSKIAVAMRQVDWVPLLTQQVVDDFASHIRLYRRSKEKSEQQRAKQRYESDASLQSNDSSVSDDLETLFFDLELEMEKHYCRDLVSTSSHYESAYLHDLTSILLYLLLPEDDFDDKPSFFLLRETLVKKVFVAALDLLSDADFVNRTVVWLLSDIPVDYEHFLTIIEACKNGEELAAVQEILEQEIAFQRSRDTGGEDDNLIKQQLRSLIFVRKLIAVRIRRLRDGGDSSDSVSLSEFGLGRVDSSDLYDLSLSFVLTNSLSLSYFLDFLDGIGGKSYIDFYLTIEGFKTSIDHMLSTSAMLKGKASGLSLEDLETVREAALAMYGQFIAGEDENRVVLPEPVVKKFSANIHSKTVPPSSWFDEVQQKVYDILKTDFRFYPSFKRSPLYLKILNELKLSPGLSRRSDDLDSVCQGEDALDVMSIQSGDSYESSEPLSHSNLTFPVIRDWDCYLRAQIHDIGIGSENNHPFALYHIAVQKDTGLRSGDGMTSWNVTRRYSDFYTLHEVISKKFPGLSVVDFPGKKAFNNMSYEFLERRKQALNNYLRVLLQPRNLRLHVTLEQTMMEFLSQKEYAPDRFLIGNKLTSLVNPIRTGVKTLGSAVVAVPDTLFDSVVRVGDGLNRVTKTVFGVGNVKPKTGFPSPEGRVGARLDTALSDNIPLRILLLLMDEVFGLRQRNQWFRRQLVAFLQQLIHATFGSSINRKIVDFVRWLTSETQTAEYLKAFKNSIWPGGALTSEAPARPLDVRMRTRVVARMKMLAALPDELRLFIGDETSREGVSLVFEALQNPRLNRRLCYVLLERLLRAVFPGNNFDQVLTKLHSKSPRSQMHLLR